MSYLDEVKAQAIGRWAEIISSVAGIPYALLDGKPHHCPKCGGKDRFRLIKKDDGAVLCNQCFKTKNGDGISAVQWMRECNFKDALELVGEYLGVKKKKRGAASNLEFRDWADHAAAGWSAKKGIGVESIRANGGRIASWRSANNGNFGVIGFPIAFGAGRAPRGWIMVNSAGGTLPTKDGERKKILVTSGSKTGWVGLHALENAEKAQYVWKVEGPSDLLALWQAIPPAARAAHVVVTNPFGAGEKPKDAHLELFRDKTVIVCHDADIAGKTGASTWSKQAARVANRTIVVDLPDGEDLRSWLSNGGDFVDLAELARKSRRVEVEEKTGEGDERRAELEDDDPFRLALNFIAQRAKRVAVQNGAVHYWEDSGWRIVEDTDFRADVQFSIVSEFQRLADEANDAARKSEDGPKPAKKTTSQLVSGVAQHVRDATCVSARLEYGTMLDREIPGRTKNGERRELLALDNGLLDLERLVETGKRDLEPHRPEWWSLSRLPYKFDPKAKIGPYWRQFLKGSMGDHEEDIRTLQQWLGYLLLPDTSHQKFLVLHGQGGNGKSVLCAVIEALLGSQNISAVALESFGERFALADTVGKLVNIVSDAPELDKVAEGKLKEFTSGDTMRFDRKNKPSFQARPTARLVLSCNNLPRVADKSEAVWRRTSLLILDREISRETRIGGMDRPKFWIEKDELPGLLNFAIEGLVDLRISGAFNESTRAGEALEEWRRMANPAREFLLERLEAEPQGFVPTNEIYKEYREWCSEKGYSPLSSGQFGAQVKLTFRTARKSRQRGGSTGRSWGYSGIGKKTPWISD